MPGMTGGGGGVLRRFRVTIDYPGKILRLA
jgi:hypothetical protein